MQIHNVDQNSDEWLSLRLGIPTASEFGKILTATGKPSTQKTDYMNKLLAEWMTGKPVDSWGGNEHTERGHELEDDARSDYEFMHDVQVTRVGFVTRDDGLVGCSPDGLVGDDGGHEIKCPSGGVHVSYLLKEEVPTKYIPQVQGSIMVCERDWWDFTSYHPDMESLHVRVYRDDDYIQQLNEELKKFIDKMLKMREQLKSIGAAA